MKVWVYMAGAILCCASVYASQNNVSLEQAQQQELARVGAAQASQQRVNQSSDQALALQQEIAQLQHELDNQRYYQQHLQALIASQLQELESIAIQQSQLEQSRQGLVPLSYRLLAGLQTAIEQDKPIHIVQRQANLQNLQQLMGQADVSDAQKLTRILSAYQMELAYGTELGVYRQQVSLEVERELELLHFGKAVWIARSLDQQAYWSWDAENLQWQVLTADLHADLALAYALAAKQAAPQLLRLPVFLALAVEEEDE